MVGSLASITQSSERVKSTRGHPVSPGMVPLFMKATCVGIDTYIYYPTALRSSVQITPKTSPNITRTNIKQLLDEVEHDIMNYQNRGLCYLPKPKAEADNTDTRF